MFTCRFARPPAQHSQGLRIRWYKIKKYIKMKTNPNIRHSKSNGGLIFVAILLLTALISYLIY